ncbi:MAG: MarR family winged helix-turn-helix transcriptional regulator [Oscillospiraceae bacterium]|nr:MarR family winged helix-turn-helix transcriptional regulator [Oscillospiraceae bacterium]
MENAHPQDVTLKLHHTIRSLGHMLHFGLDAHRNRNRILSMAAAHGSIPQNVLTEEIGIAPASMSEALAKLEAEGLVCRAPSEEDRRTFTVTITGQGRVHLEESRRRDEEEILRLYECLSAEERERLLELLGRLESFWREALPEDGENRRKKGGRRARPARD